MRLWKTQKIVDVSKARDSIGKEYQNFNGKERMIICQVLEKDSAPRVQLIKDPKNVISALLSHDRSCKPISLIMSQFTSIFFQ
jgi:hypothetical protein